MLTGQDMVISRQISSSPLSLPTSLQRAVRPPLPPLPKRLSRLQRTPQPPSPSLPANILMIGCQPTVWALREGKVYVQMTRELARLEQTANSTEPD